jgi:hypothetical protein
MHDVRKSVRIEEFRDHHRVAAITEHPDFHRGDFAILGQHIQLGAQFRARREVDGFDALRVLHGERGDGGDAVATVSGESFQVGGSAGAAGRIESRNRQQDGRCWVAVSVRGHRLFLLQRRK